MMRTFIPIIRDLRKEFYTYFDKEYREFEI